MSLEERRRKFEKDLASNLDSPGWTVIGVGGDPVWAYTLGLEYNFNHPEIIVFGLPCDVAHSILNDIGKLIKNDNLVYFENKDYYGIFKGFSAQFKCIKPTEHMGCAVSFYKPKSFSALQLCWPDEVGHFPWDNRFNPEFKKYQPLIGVDL